MSDSEVELIYADDIFRIILNRVDKRNALTRDMLVSIGYGLRHLAPSCKLVVLSANGPAFCAGMDLQEMQTTAQLPNAQEVWREDTELYRQVAEMLFFLPCPTLCVVQGPVLAGGVGLVLACDLVIASPAASFALPEPKRGITASLVSPLLSQRVGAGRAGWLLLSGQAVSAEAAERWGLIHRLVEQSALPGELDRTIAAVLSGAPGALRSTKQQLLANCGQELRAAWTRGSELSATARAQPEAREGLQAFLEKRQPNWIA